MGYNDSYFWLILLIMLPLLIIVVDFILKSLYILYWDNVFNYKIDHLINSLNGDKLKVRRKSIDNKYILISTSYYNSELYEFIGDDKGVIFIKNTTPKIVKPFFQKGLISINTIKLNKDLLKKYENIIYDKKKYIVQDYRSIPFFDSIKIYTQNTKINKNDLLYVKTNKNNKDIDIKMKAIKFYNRKKESYTDLSKLVSIVEFIMVCVKESLINEKDMDKKITELIYNKVY